MHIAVNWAGANRDTTGNNTKEQILSNSELDLNRDKTLALCDEQLPSTASYIYQASNTREDFDLTIWSISVCLFHHTATLLLGAQTK